MTMTSDFLAKGPMQIKTLRFVGKWEFRRLERKHILFTKSVGLIVTEVLPVFCFSLLCVTP